MSNYSHANSPLPLKTILSPGSENNIRAAADLPYPHLIGSLQWLARTTQPDITYAVSQLASFNASWTIEHWTKAKHVLLYLRLTQHQSIRYDSRLKFHHVFQLRLLAMPTGTPIHHWIPSKNGRGSRLLALKTPEGGGSFDHGGQVYGMC